IPNPEIRDSAQRTFSEADIRHSTQVRRPWFLWVGGAVAVAAVVLLVFAAQTGTIPFKQLFKTQSQSGLSKLSLVIPAANAGDAFSMLVEKQNDGTAELDTSFQINSKVDIDQDKLKQSLRVVKVSDQGDESVPFDFNKTGDNQFNVKPQNELETGSVYRVVIATAVQGETGDLRQRDFSWAVQTKDVFKIIRAVPGDASTGVPLDTAIELTLSQVGWQDPAQYFAVEPQVDGRFETHGRTLVFLPNKPLSPLTLYTVTFKKGWGLGDGGSTLNDDYSIRFQTSSGRVSSAQKYINVTSYLFESAPGTEPVIGVWYSDVDKPVTVTGYSLSFDDAKSVIQKIESQPSWIDATDIRNKTLADKVGGQAFTQQANLENVGEYSKGIRLSNSISAGFYAIRLDQEGVQPTWVLLQVTNLAAYSMADKDQILVWTVNTETGKPVETTVSMDGQAVKTDSQGTARLKTPESWSASDTNITRNAPAVVLELGEGSMRLLSVLRKDWEFMYFGSSYGGNGASFDTWSYLYSDRPLYRSQDKINVFGLLQDRNSNRGTGTAEVRLMNRSFIDYGTYDSKVYAKADLNEDNAGFFSGQISWSGTLTPGYYELVLFKDGQRVTSRSIEIRDTVKPAYYLQVVPERVNVFTGEQAKGQLIAKFFDGTPVAKAKILLNASGGFDSTNQPLTVTTDDAGYASYSFNLGTPKCDLGERYQNCYAQTNLSIEARPAVGEEGEIYAYASYNVWGSHSSLNEDSIKEDNGNATLRYRVRKVDPSKANGRTDDSVLTDGQASVSVKAKFIEQHWDKTQTGTYFDSLEKKVVPQYRYVQRDVEAGNFDAVTDTNGYATFNYQLKDNISYRVVVWTDNGGATQSVTSYVSKGWYDRSGNDAPSLVSTDAADNRNSFNLGDKVSLSFTQSGQKMSGENESFMFVHAARGIRSLQVSSNATHEFDFTEEDVPNMTVYGVVFSKNGFAMSQYSVMFDSQSRELNVVIEPDKTSYAPGENINFRAKVTDKNSNVIKDAHIAVSVVDEALLSIAQLGADEMPLNTLYQLLPDG
ncbi:MAG: Ig-like domain-containing protein, partial [Patescibacteria group bacterium]